MKLQEALNIINNKTELGFMVSFEVKNSHILTSDYFPDKHSGEKLIETENEAWELAEKFAKATDENHVNIYVINHEFRPVANYQQKQLKKYPK